MHLWGQVYCRLCDVLSMEVEDHKGDRKKIVSNKYYNLEKDMNFYKIRFHK